MSGLAIFSNPDFGLLRWIMRNGEPWFVANDVAAALKYADTKQAVRQHCKYAELFKGVDSTPLTDSPRGIKIIPESDVYRLIIKSTLPKAEEFERWVMEEALPSIRKTGSYSSMPALPDFTNPAEAARAWAEQYEKRQLAEKQAAEAEENNVILREAIGCATEWKQAKAIKWIPEYYNLDNSSTWANIGKTLSKLSRAMGKEIRKVEDSAWGTVNVYHISVVELFKRMTEENPDMLAEYRKK